MVHDDAPYRDPSLSVQRRVDDLLGRMTLAETVGQAVGFITTGLDDCREKIADHHLGVASPFGHGGYENNTPEAAARLANDLQRFAVEETRLGVPLLFYTDADHGHARISGATAFPHNLGMAATRNTDLQEEAAGVTASEVAATGAHQNLNPTADVARDPRWGRVYETYGESPFLCGAFASAKVRGYQGDSIAGADSVVATPKHFPAYGDPTRGEDASSVDVSEYTLRETFLPPFEAAFDAGARSAMPCYNDLDGEPVHGSRRYLTDLLREELGFDGYVVSDWGGVHMLHDDHRTAASMDEAVWQAATAGLDVASVAGPDYAERLRSLVEAGHVSQRRIEASARRVLGVKFELGLFEDPFVDVDRAGSLLGNEANREVARRAARESLTLLKNDDGVLPFDPGVDEVFVGGPSADALAHQFGGWSSVADPEPPATTVRQGVESVVGPGTTVTYERGATVTDTLDVASARDAAARADAAVLAVGEGRYVHEFSEEFGESGSGEFPNRTRLALPNPQWALVEAILETGTPTAVVLLSGRPLAVDRIADRTPALLMAYYPGTDGGLAVAEALFGEYNPGGALPVSVPKSTGHLPSRFNYRPHPRPVGHESEGGSHLDSYDPLFPFGHGLSYTEFDYRDLSLSAGTVGPEGTVDVEVTVENVGDRAGDATVDLFVTDEYSSRVTPVRELVGFDRVPLDPGEAGTVTFTVDAAADLGIERDDGRRFAEAGEFVFRAEGLEASLSVAGTYH